MNRFCATPTHLIASSVRAKATNKLVHPNLVGTLDYGVDPKPYIVMDFVEGETLEALLAKQKVLSIEEFVRFFEQVCSGMNLAHESGCVHRDLKPSNIMIETKTGTVKVVDFGLIKVKGQELTKTGDVMGSPPYMSPEQCLGKEVDARTDIYSLGCIMYEALTGVTPFEGTSAIESIYLHFNSAPPPVSQVRKDLQFPKEIDYVVARALADLRDRYTSMEELRQDLHKAASGTLKRRWYKIKRPSYSKTIFALARFCTIGNWVLLIGLSLYILLLSVGALSNIYGFGSFK